MAEVQHSQIKAKLLDVIAPLVDASDISAKSATDKEVHVLSRAMAAVAIKMLAEVDNTTAANTIVDGSREHS